VIVQVLVHGAESLFIAPKAYQETLSLNPIVILSAVTAGTALMGVIGAIIAVPLVAFFWVAFKEVRARQAATPAATADA
jgi:predicted PurR-regulated permease PerM